MKYLLDTHVWIWWNINSQQLSEKIINLISDAEADFELLLSAISPWEFSKLLEKGRISISCDPEEWILSALDIPRMRLVPITPKIAYRSTILPGIFHEDPADQIIVATARDENATILTKDKKISSYNNVHTLW
jgi:PIN domain nuclease of toxin-antitoxin system